jgi:hypothetical protein
MKKLWCLMVLSGTYLGLLAQNEYFFPKGQSYDSTILSPEDYLGYSIGTYHTRYDQVVGYFRQLAASSPMARLQVIGHTVEQRPQIILTITHPDNFDQLEEIRQNHLKIADPAEPLPALDKQPVVSLLGYNVHGNEPSSTEAAMLTAYYLLACKSAFPTAVFKNCVVIIDPAYNPDGRDRHTHWANTNRSEILVSDGADREHNEGWPGGRTNHYWFDLNRDWLPLAQVESQNRIEFYHQWLPNIATDYHEMGTNSTYFFEPTEAYGAENPLVPRSNYDDLNGIFAQYFSKALDEVGSLYFSGESFDNSYPGYGSTYPDIHGGLGLLFEQASSRGHLQETTTLPISFAFTIRNHVRTSIATVQAGIEHRLLLHAHLRAFFENAQKDGKNADYQAIYFGDATDFNKTRIFTNFLLKHRIEVHALAEKVEINGQIFEPGTAFVVPSDQKQFKMVQTIFEPVTTFHDSVFYDASAWAVALAFNMPFEKSSRVWNAGAPLTEPISTKMVASAKSEEKNYAYLIEYSDYLAPALLYDLQKNGLFVKAAFKPFTMDLDGQSKTFGYGTLLVAVKDQSLSEEEVHQRISKASHTYGIPVFPVATGFTQSGIDLGSRYFQTVQQPKVAVLTGSGVSAYEAGELWHLLDTRFGLPLTKVDVDQFRRLDLQKYNTLILVSGNYQSLGKRNSDLIKNWVAAGNTLILQRSAIEFALAEEWISEEKVEVIPSENEGQRQAYVESSERSGARQIGGSVYEANLDITHPIGFGYQRDRINVYRNHSIFMKPSSSPYSTVVQYGQKNQLDGYVHRDWLPYIKESASVLVSPMGRGRAISFVDNPNFRGFWYGTNKMMLNAIFFGSHVSVPR